MDPVSIVAGGVAFATALKDIISLGLKLRESLQNMKQDMNELQMLSQELLTDMYRLQAFYERVSVIDSSQSDHLSYELDGVKLCLERILKRCQNLALGRNVQFLPLWSEWNFRRTLENELPRLRRQVENIRSQFMFHSNIRIENALLVQSTDHSALLHKSQGAVAALLSNPDSEYSQSIVAEMNSDAAMGAYNSVGFQYLKLQIMTLWKLAERPLSNPSTMSVRPVWDPHSAEPKYMTYSPPVSIKSLSQKVLSLFLGFFSGQCSNGHWLLNGLTDIAWHIAALEMNPLFPSLMTRVEDAAKRIASNQRGFTVDHAYYIYRLAFCFFSSGDTESAITWGVRGLHVLRDARSTGLWSGENTSHLSANLQLFHGLNCLRSPQWITHAEAHLVEAQNISRRLLDLSPPYRSVLDDWLKATVHLIKCHQRINQPQQALSQMLLSLSCFLDIDINDVDQWSIPLVRMLNSSIQEAIITFKGHDIPLTAVHKVLSLSKQLSKKYPDLFAGLFLCLLSYTTVATYFLAQDLRAPSEQQLCLMQACLGARLDDADSRCLDTQLRLALSSSLELQGEDYVFDTFFAYLFLSDTSGFSLDQAVQSFFLDIITQLAIRFPLLLQRAVGESSQRCTNAAMKTSSFGMEAIADTVLSNIQSLPFKPNAPITTSTIHTLLSLLPNDRKTMFFEFFIALGNTESARALVLEHKSELGTACKFMCSSIELQPDSLSLALDAAKSLDLFSTYIIEYLASRHQHRESFAGLKGHWTEYNDDVCTTHWAIVMYHAGSYRRAQKLLQQAGSIKSQKSFGFWLPRYYAALIHYHLLQFDEGLEVMQDITDEVRLWSPHGYPDGVPHHGRARLFQIYASLLAAVNRLSEALDAAQEATRSYQSIVVWGPGFGPFFAQSLETYAEILERSEASRDVGSPVAEGESIHPTSVDTWTEAVDVWRGLVKKDEFFSMSFVDCMEVYIARLERVGRDEDCEMISKEIEHWRERAEKVRKDKNKDIEELEKAWKEAYPDWTDDMDEEEQLSSADEEDGVEDPLEFFSADEGDSEDAKE